MKKMFLWVLGIVVIIFLALAALGSFVNTSDSKIQPTIKNTYGFSITPPPGWFLWEGVSAYRDALNKGVVNEDGNDDLNEIKNYLRSWTPENSSVLTFTTHANNLTTREISIVGKLINEIYDDPMAFEQVDVIASPTEPMTYIAATSTPSQLVKDLTINGVHAQYIRLANVRAIHGLRLPLVSSNNQGTLLISKLTEKDAPEALPQLTSFANAISFEN